jgi:hypothetical protein
MEGVANRTRQNKVTLQIVNDWENVAIENKTKAMLYDKFI